MFGDMCFFSAKVFLNSRSTAKQVLCCLQMHLPVFVSSGFLSSGSALLAAPLVFTFLPNLKYEYYKTINWRKVYPSILKIKLFHSMQCLFNILILYMTA